MSVFTKNICLIVGLYVSSVVLLGQSVTHITTLQGLNTNNLTSVIKDHNNYMWVGSYNGLHKHEGARIKVFDKVGKDSTAISSPEMHTLFEDRQGFIWIGTTGGLDKLNPTTGLIALSFAFRRCKIAVGWLYFVYFSR